MENVIQLMQKHKGKIVKNEEYDLEEFLSILYSGVKITGSPSLRSRWKAFWHPKDTMDDHIVMFVDVIRKNINHLIEGDND